MQTKINESTFAGQEIFVGIDVHLKSWKVTVMAGDMHLKTFSAPPDPGKLFGYLRTHYPGATYNTAYEAGFSGFWAHREFAKLGVNSIVVNPADIPTTDKERKQKEDRRDSRKIAKTLQAKQLRGIFIPSEKMQQDRALLRARDAILSDLRRNKARTKGLLYFHGIQYPERFENSGWSKQFLEWLRNIKFDHNCGRSALDALLDMVEHQRTLLLRLTRQVRELSKSDEYNKKVELLLSVPGLGILTAMRFLTELGTLHRFPTFPKFCSYIGIVPSTDSSADKEIVLGITPRRNLQLRTAIVESAWIAVRRDPALLTAYQTLRNRMPANKAIVRIAKKLLSRIWHVLHKEEQYEMGVIR